ncbi:ribonuclease P [Candidatus Phytoplasma luffae]|uniref:Ribonuclease P protein component n=1 Tax=Loofah witches'-broom phytoplasma TaxID=35773 RepID=A0A975FJX2_LOWBP|nr:ribonuclease P protein component [Candidatus Phytoplasma luffae]QTX03206.1 ribonuclease P [Candidatus Phytoplasma luffae]
MKKKNICKNKNELDLIFKLKQKVKNYFFILYFIKKKLDHFKFVLSISKKYGKAYERNLIKRRLRMIIHKNMSLIDKNIIFIVIIKPTAKELDFANLEKKFLVLIKKIF